MNGLKKLMKSLIFKNIYDDLMDLIHAMQRYKQLSIQYQHNYLLKNFFAVRSAQLHKKIFIKYSCDITPECKLGKVIFRHPIGIVIGGGANLSDGVIIHQNVTFGALRFDENERRGIFCEQFVGENTIICTGAKVLGDVKIGKNCLIGANAVLTVDVPDNSVVVGYNKILPKK